jgi:hydrogenase nickel incorporation protein HypA/HybF
VHELSVAQSLVELIEAELAQHPACGRVIGATLRIGELSGVVPAALASAFGPATAGTCIDGATLEILAVPVVIWCDACDCEQVLAPPAARLVCPACGKRASQVLRGRELELVSVEVVEDRERRDVN